MFPRKHRWRYDRTFAEYRSNLGALIRRRSDGKFECYQTYGIRVRDHKKIAETVTEAMDLCEGLGLLERIARAAWDPKEG